MRMIMPVKPTVEEEARDEANFMSKMLEWSEVRKIAVDAGFKGNSSNPGEVARFLAWRLKRGKRSLLYPKGR
jgi:hypothetical protein